MIFLSRYPTKAYALLLLFLMSLCAHSLPEKGLSVTLSADEMSVYIYAQLIVTVEIKTALTLRNGTIGKLDIKDAIVEAISEDDQDEILENGVAIQVFRRSYAVFPTKTGTLSIPGINFEGVVAGKESNGFFPGFFSQGKRIMTNSNDLKITVKDIPISYPKDQPFLPLKHLEITDTFGEPDPKFEVNKATTRRFNIKAVGNLSSALPALRTPRIKNMQIYAEAGEKIQNATSDGIVAEASVSHVYLPSNPGEVHIPEQKIYWWDIKTDQLKTTVIRSLDILVEGIAAAAVEPPNELLPSPKVAKEENVLPKTTTPKVVAAAAKAQNNSLLWPLLALLFLFLWLATMVFLALTMRRIRQLEKIKLVEPLETRFQKLWQSLKEACDNQEGKKALKTLNAFYREALQKGISKNTEQELSSCLVRLEDALYRNPNEEHMKEALKYTKKTMLPLKDPNSDKPALAPLYPL